ncbi:MAG TPA: ATP-binding protein [Candidatus Obscuribacterales bacterium]
MLIEFSVGNYLSFQETVTFSLVASKVVSSHEELDENNVFNFDDELRLVKSAAVYGANASGKSNLIKAMGFMARFILTSSKETQVGDEIDVKEFKLNTQTLDKHSFFEIVFILDQRIYRYGFEVNRERVISEWLFHVPKVKEINLFQRNFDQIEVKKQFEKQGKEIFERTRPNALFLSVVAQFNGVIAKNILLFFREKFNVLSGLREHLYQGYTIAQFKKYPDPIIQLIKQLDLDIDNIIIQTKVLRSEQLPNELPEELRQFIMKANNLESNEIQTIHKKYDDQGKIVSLEKFNLDEDESEGTKKVFAFAGLILETLTNGEVLVIDELDAKLHPLITQTLINLFNSKTTNPKNSQLIFTTHDTNLLNNKIFRLDQIWFTEKNNQGASDLYSLIEYKVSSDASLESDYIKGKYGAIPFIGNLEQLFNR